MRNENQLKIKYLFAYSGLLLLCLLPIFCNYIMEGSIVKQVVQIYLVQGFTEKTITCIWQLILSIGYACMILCSLYSMRMIFATKSIFHRKVLIGAVMLMTCPNLFYFTYELGSIWGFLALILLPLSVGFIFFGLYEHNILKKGFSFFLACTLIICVYILFVIAVKDLHFYFPKVQYEGYTVAQLFSLYQYAPDHPGLGIGIVTCLVWGCASAKIGATKKNPFRLCAILGFLCLFASLKRLPIPFALQTLFFAYGELLLCIYGAHILDEGMEECDTFRRWISYGVFCIFIIQTIYRLNMFTYSSPSVFDGF